jgi:glucose-6-phosphate isomerase
VNLNKKKPSNLDSWKKLNSNFKTLSSKTLTEYFAEDLDRVDKLSINWESFYVDYSKNRLDKSTIDLLVSLAKESGLKEGIEAYFSGEEINETEGRAVLHTALRTQDSTPVLVKGENILHEIVQSKKKNV